MPCPKPVARDVDESVVELSARRVTDRQPPQITDLTDVRVGRDASADPAGKAQRRRRAVERSRRRVPYE